MTDISTLTVIIIDHVLSVARAVCDTIVAAGPSAISTARFEEVNPIDLALPSANDKSILISMDTLCCAQLTNGSSCVWGKKTYKLCRMRVLIFLSLKETVEKELGV